MTTRRLTHNVVPINDVGHNLLFEPAILARFSLDEKTGTPASETQKAPSGQKLQAQLSASQANSDSVSLTSPAMEPSLWLRRDLHYHQKRAE